MIEGITMRVATVGILAAGLLLSGVAGAEGEKRFGEEILEILRDEGRISEERYQELSELEQKEAEEAAKAEREDGWTIKYSNGLKFIKNDGMVKFNIGGRIQADFASIHVAGQLDRAVSGGDGEGVEFRRARFYMSGELYKRIIWKSQIDFADGDVTLRDMYIGMKGLGFLGTGKVGHMKEPFSLEELTSSKYLTFMERSLPSVFDSSRNFGLAFSNAVLDERMTWAAGIFADTDDGGEFFNGDRDFNVSARVTGLPVYADGGRKLIHVGLSALYRVLDKETVRFRQRPEIHLAKRYIDTDFIESDGTTLLVAEFAVVLGPVHVSSEYKHAFVDKSGNSLSNGHGAYVQAGWFLTGESRPYKKSSGIWTRVNPTNPFEPGAGKWGALEVAGRWSYLNLNSNDLNAGKEWNLTGALNWYLFSNVRLSANYVYARVRSTGDFLGNARGDIHAFQARAQLEF